MLINIQKRTISGTMHMAALHLILVLEKGEHFKTSIIDIESAKHLKKLRPTSFGF